MPIRLPQPDRYRPLTARMQGFILVLAIATAATVMLSILFRPGSPPPPPRAVAPDAARCVAGQTMGCVGGMAAVIVLPASAAPAR